MLGKIRERLKGYSLYQYLALLGVLVLVFFTFFYKLGNLTSGLSPAETAAASNSKSLHAIISNPLFAPHHLLQYPFTHFISNSNMYLRLPSVIFGIIFVGLFYYLIRSWFGKTVAFFASLIAFSSPIIILSSRSATPAILLLSPLVILAGYTYIDKSKSVLGNKLFIFSAVIALILYTPGIIWLLLAGSIYKRRQLANHLRSVNQLAKTFSLLIFLILITPLIYGFYHHTNLIQPWLLLTGDWSNFFDLVKQFGWAITSLIYKTPTQLDLTIGRLPLLDITQIVLLVFGAYAMVRLAATKIYPLVFLIFFSLIATTMTGSSYLLLISLPAILVFMSAGLRYLLVEWKAVFPKNPIPKYLALSLVSLIVGLHILYGLTYSLSAWPKTEATKSTYVIK